MKKSTLLTVTKGPNQSYCLTLNHRLKAPRLYYAPKAYTGQRTALGPFNGTQMWIKSPDPLNRLYFLVESEDHPPLWAGLTGVEIEQIQNFRDMGGYLTQQGTTVKWGTFFRSGTLVPLKGDEKEIYQGMNIDHVFDYRSQGEKALAPDEIPQGTLYHPVPAIDEENNVARLASADIGSMMAAINTKGHADKAKDLFADLYRQLPFKNKAYAALFRAMAQGGQESSFLQHCSAGKDRTGVGCALTLLALGVDEETVMQDYLLSALFRNTPEDVRDMKKYANITLSDHAMEVAALLAGVSKELLNATFDTIKKKYNSYEAFFLAEYGFNQKDLEALRQKYTF